MGKFLCVIILISFVFSGVYGQNDSPLTLDVSLSVDGVIWKPADQKVGVIVPAGTPLTFRINLTNHGDAPLTNINLTDYRLDLSPCTIPAQLATGQTYSCTLAPVEAVEWMFVTTTYVSAMYKGQQHYAQNGTYYFGGKDLLKNGGFEREQEVKSKPAGWQGRDLTHDKRVCNKPAKQVAYSGKCALRFKGFVNETSRWIQTVKPQHVRSLGGQDSLTLTAAVKGNLEGAGLLVHALIVYDKPIPRAFMKQRLSLTFSGGVFSDYVFVSSERLTLSGPVKRIKVRIRYKGISGKVFVDEVRLLRAAAVEPAGQLAPPQVLSF